MKYVPVKRIIVLFGPAISICVDSSRLILKSGFPYAEPIKEEIISKGTNDIDHIVVSGSGYISFDAVRWLMSQDIIVSLVDNYGNIITDWIPQYHISTFTKRKQATASNEFNLKIAGNLLAEKFQEQRRTLQVLFSNFKNLKSASNRIEAIKEATSVSKRCESELPACLSVSDLLLLEAESASFYWKCFEGISLFWKKEKNVHDHWKVIQFRASPKSGSARFAVDPFNACLNYLYAVLESRVRFACMTHRIDPDFGVLHADHANRTSLVFDLMEPLRPHVDRILYEFTRTNAFVPGYFFETREGICIIMPELTSKIIPLIKKLDLDVKRIVKDFSRFFKIRVKQVRPHEISDASLKSFPIFKGVKRKPE
jgi:CRISPR-associated protein Cas1